MSDQPKAPEPAPQMASTPAEAPKIDTLAKPESTQPAPVSAATPPSQPKAPMPPMTMPPVENLYQFGLTDADRDRLIAQTMVFSQFLRDNMRKTLVNFEPQEILDVGCGEGQLTRTLGDIYYTAHIVGMDKDQNAINKANEDQTKYLVDKPIDFVVADAEQEMPPGKFDMIYCSLVLMYVKDVEHTLKLMFDALKPGGFIWIKESHPEWLTAFKNNSTFARYNCLSYASFIRVGGHPFMGPEMPEMLPRVGFANVQYIEERYLLDYTSMNGRIGISIFLGVLYNLRKLITRMEQVPEETLLAMHQNMRDHAKDIRGNWIHSNIIAQKPLAKA